MGMSTSQETIPINTEQIELSITTNKPDDDGKTIFTKSVLFHPSINKKRFAKYTEYPHISDNVLIDVKKLKSKKYVEKMDFFFNRSVFEEFMNKVNDKAYQDELLSKVLKGKIDKKDILDYNIKVMIDMLFPTAYPFINNTGNSYDRNFTSKSKDLDIVFFPKYSYIKNKSEVYTVTKAILLNDILNHPKYYDFIVMMFDYITWANNERDKISNDFNTMNMNIKKTFETPISSNVFESLEKQRNTTQNGMKKFIIMDLLKILNNRQNMDMGYVIGEYYLCKIPSVENILRNYFKNYILEKLQQKYDDQKFVNYTNPRGSVSPEHLNKDHNTNVRTPLKNMIETLEKTSSNGDDETFVFLKYNEVKAVKATEKKSEIGKYDNLTKQLDISNKYIINKFNNTDMQKEAYEEVKALIEGSTDNPMYEHYDKNVKKADQGLLEPPKKAFILNSLLLSEEDTQGNILKAKSFFKDDENPIIMKFKQIDWKNKITATLKVDDKEYSGTIEKKCDKFIFRENDPINEDLKEAAKTLLTNNVNEDTQRDQGIYTISETELFENFILQGPPGEPIPESPDKLRLQKIDKLLNTYKDYTNIRSYGSDSSPKISDSKFNTFIENLENQRNAIISMETFKNEYLECCEGEGNDNPIECVKLYVNDKNKYDERFDQFKETIEKYKEYMSTKYENKNKSLQDLIDNYGNNANREKSKKLVNMILQIYQDNIQERNINRKTVSLTDYIQLYANNINKDKPKKPSFQAHLLLNVIKGEVNDKNKHLVRCNFEDRYLNKRFYMFFVNLKDQEQYKEINYPYVELKNDGTFKEVPKTESNEAQSDEGQDLVAPV